MRLISFHLKNQVINYHKTFLGILLFFLLPLSNFAVTLAEYRRNIETAKDLTIELLYPDNEDMSLSEYLKFERANLSEIRTKVPATEKVVWNGGEIETNNQWLIEKLNEFEKEAENSPNREVVLNAIYERLDAIGQKIEEVENAQAASRTKDEDKQKLSEILRREEYQKPEATEESLFQKMLRKIKEWLSDLFPEPNVPQNAASGFQSLSFVLQMLLYALILGVIGFLAYRFAPFFFSRFRRREKREKKERVILGERLSADETAQNLFNQAEQLAQTGNLRGAIRKGYIALLCELNDRKIIGLAHHKTNRDYLRDVRKRRELFENMNSLTSNFERHWYGFESADFEDWEDFRNGYKKAVETI